MESVFGVVSKFCCRFRICNGSGDAWFHCAVCCGSSICYDLRRCGRKPPKRNARKTRQSYRNGSYLWALFEQPKTQAATWKATVGTIDLVMFWGFFLLYPLAVVELLSRVNDPCCFFFS